MKHLALFILSICLFFTGNAQQIKVNPQVGINASRVYPQDNTIGNSGGKGGYEIGADIRIGDFDNWFFWQPGVHYYISNASLQVEPTNSSDIIQLSSLKIPLNGGMYLTGSDGILRVRANVGLVPTILLQQEESALGEEYTDFNSFGLAASAGIGFDIAFITLDAKYEYGLTQIYNSGNGRMDVLSFTLGVVIPPTF